MFLVMPCAIALGAILLGGGFTAAFPQTFSDSTFNDADWEVFAEIFIDIDLLGDGTVSDNPGVPQQCWRRLLSVNARSARDH